MKFYECHKCNYKTTRKRDFDRHLDTEKHKKLNIYNYENSIDKHSFKCKYCDNFYKSSRSLSRHANTCKYKQIIVDNSRKNKNDYDMLKGKYDTLQDDYNELIKTNDKLLKQSKETIDYYQKKVNYLMNILNENNIKVILE